jgi:putative ABC transport system ATP-binding protein
LVLADEPTAGLDPASKALVVEVLLGYVRSCGATLLMVTHDLELLSRFDLLVDLQNRSKANP